MLGSRFCSALKLATKHSLAAPPPVACCVLCFQAFDLGTQALVRCGYANFSEARDSCDAAASKPPLSAALQNTGEKERIDSCQAHR